MLVGVMGLMGSGKDSVSRIFIEEGYGKISFADSLKDSVASVFDFDREVVEGVGAKNRKLRETVDQWWSDKLGIPDFTPRKALQIMGTDIMRNHLNDDIWVNNTMRRASKMDNCIISDVRFINEAKSIKDAGGILIRVQRGLPEWWNDAVEASLGNEVSINRLEEIGIHRSEWDCASCAEDIFIDNGSSLKSLKRRSREVYTEINGIKHPS